MPIIANNPLLKEKLSRKTEKGCLCPVLYSKKKDFTYKSKIPYILTIGQTQTLQLKGGPHSKKWKQDQNKGIGFPTEIRGLKQLRAEGSASRGQTIHLVKLQKCEQKTRLHLAFLRGKKCLVLKRPRGTDWIG